MALDAVGLDNRILLATDLSARSDRALDRAMMIARRREAELVVLHVLEPIAGNRYYPRTQTLPVLAELARAQILHDLGDCAEKAQIRVEEGNPAEVIEQVAAQMRATVVVVGVARVERLGRFVLGATVERLVRTVEAPLLIVTDRPRQPYERIAVAVDFSSVSSSTIELATATFPTSRITAFHAYEPLTYGSPDAELVASDYRKLAERAFTEWLASANLSAETRERMVARIEQGEPALLLREAAAQGQFDLVVVGTRGRGRISEFFIGSVAKRILSELPCDALFVREAK